ncbi:hypothetical protein ASPVEDRAFT_82144 [Aspergillus versicolor CBS 583.65]|uniref:Uncharacterized protein n=1 Tax=Aspergillus versicolor CBS 583.65 TaxID=1036611 RepID=A0A1L9PGD4_ASPVE|nr:uncharacterized protein ASPVEDRAFT_82144 [Aspergillus versicolor CBS 583.65]OJJ00580.1 hypothetical protein ASPVEDRAFT_82144 [Aspergillus versicolor CBS 583.65]
MPAGLGKASDDPNNDDYVAQVLAREARDSSMKYSTVGMEAYRPPRPAGSAPKPNTRFLRHIIRDTDNHNAALKRKEEREARERMRQMRDQVRSSAPSDSRDHRSRRSHRTDDRDSHREREYRDGRHSSHRRRHRSRSTSADKARPRTSRRERESRGRDDDRHRRSRKDHRYPSYSRSRSRSPRERYSGSHRRHRHRRRSASRSRSPERKENRKDKDSSRRKEARTSPPEFQDRVSGNESDPLEDLVGPLPKEEAPIRSRGRGAYKPNMSNIDAHFAPDYDPSLDVQPDDDDAQASNRPTRRAVAGLMTGEDDWELSLEALRDRARWKQKGEDRLREAGFNSDIVERWKSSSSAAAGNGDEMDNVKWSSKSEGREWDRGKFVDRDGHINVKASW